MLAVIKLKYWKEAVNIPLMIEGKVVKKKRRCKATNQSGARAEPHPTAHAPRRIRRAPLTLSIASGPQWVPAGLEE